jgi:magnesium-transporting ATPase (P-type)
MTTASVDPSDETDDPRAPIYEAESPDELSLVNAAAAYGVRLIDRRPQLIVIRVVADQRRVAFHLLHVLPFDANRKRMSIVVRANDPPRHIMLYCKGADSAIFDRLSDEYLNSAKGTVIQLNEVVASKILAFDHQLKKHP